MPMGCGSIPFLSSATLQLHTLISLSAREITESRAPLQRHIRRKKGKLQNGTSHPCQEP
jgi:hypothetical protein